MKACGKIAQSVGLMSLGMRHILENEVWQGSLISFAQVTLLSFCLASVVHGLLKVVPNTSLFNIFNLNM